MISPPSIRYGLSYFSQHARDGEELVLILSSLSSSLKKTQNDPETNLRTAFDVAANALDIPPLLDVEDILNVPKPDEKPIMAYVAQYYHYFAASKKTDVAGRRIGNLVDLTRANDKLKRDYTAKASDVS